MTALRQHPVQLPTLPAAWPSSAWPATDPPCGHPLQTTTPLLHRRLVAGPVRVLGLLLRVVRVARAVAACRDGSRQSEEAAGAGAAGARPALAPAASSEQQAEQRAASESRRLPRAGQPCPGALLPRGRPASNPPHWPRPRLLLNTALLPGPPSCRARSVTKLFAAAAPAAASDKPAGKRPCANAEPANHRAKRQRAAAERAA